MTYQPIRFLKATPMRSMCPGPEVHRAFETVTLGYADDVDHLVLCENVRHFHLLFKKPSHKVNLLIDGSTVDLNLLDVGFLAAELHFANLGVADGTDNLAVLLR